MVTKKPDEVVNFRNAETGQFVTEKYVKKHPKKTVTEHNRRHTPSTSSPKKK